MRFRSPVVPQAIVLAVGVALGWLGASVLRPAPAQADSEALRHGPRWEDQEDAVVSGPVSIQRDRGNEIQVEHDGIYYLDYRGARLLAAVPSPRQSTGGTRMIDSFAERDLIADFKLSPSTGVPHFVMVTGTVGTVNGAYAPLYVFESSSKQMATYQLQPQTIGTSTRPKFDLLEVRPLPRLNMPAERP